MKYRLLLIYLLLFLFIAIASLLILRHTTQTPQHPLHSTLDSYVQEASMIEYNQKGRLQSNISAEKIEHFESKTHEFTLFIKPHMIRYDNNQTPWHIHADKATRDQTGAMITLEGNVVIYKLATAAHPATTIKTSQLIYYPNTARAVTKKAVTMIRPEMTIHGTGLIANFKTGQYQLESESEAIYIPKKSV